MKNIYYVYGIKEDGQRDLIDTLHTLKDAKKNVSYYKRLNRQNGITNVKYEIIREIKTYTVEKNYLVNNTIYSYWIMAECLTLKEATKEARYFSDRLTEKEKKNYCISIYLDNDFIKTVK